MAFAIIQLMGNKDGEIISGDQSEADDWAVGSRRAVESLPQVDLSGFFYFLKPVILATS